MSFDFNTDLEKIVMNKKLFNEIVYTPFSEVKNELKKRWENEELKQKVDSLLNSDIPEPLISEPKALIFRQLSTPNHETSYFLEQTKKLEIQPVFFEYIDDKFTSNNPLKHALGKLRFQKEFKKNSKIVTHNIIEFNIYGGKKICDVDTIWGQKLVEFHHQLLDFLTPNCDKYFFEATDWFHRGGKGAKEYYKRYVTLFLRNAVLFENFILEEFELNFVKEVFLPQFMNIWKETGFKPLITPILPFETENEPFWMSYPNEALDFLAKKIKF